MSIHPWRDEDKLKQEYIDAGKSSVELSRQWGCSKKTILNWLRRFDIPTRTENKYKPASYHTKPNGYERWSNEHDGDYNYVYVHRLLAVCEYGFDEVASSVVHHENTIKWDNRPENISLFGSQSEHGKHHEAERERPTKPWRDEAALRELYHEQEMSTREIADHFGCCKYTVQNWMDKLGVPKRPPNGEVV